MRTTFPTALLFLNSLVELESHPHYKKKLDSLSKKEKSFIYDFIARNHERSVNDFEMMINRVFIYYNPKPKKWSLILEILSVLNSRTKKERTES